MKIKTKRIIKPPILPGNLSDPTGADRLERGAMNELSRRIKRIAKAYQSILDRIPASPAVNLRYTFDLDTSLLSMLLENASALVDEILYCGNESNFWFWRDYVNQAYQRGTAQEFASLSQQSTVYAAGRESFQQLLLSEPYQRRLLLVRTRVFEEMKNLSARTKSDMARILTDGIGRGQNPRDIAKRLTEQTGMEIGRAKRIARTEITTALRRARWDESDEAEAQYGIVDGNAINCKCTQVAVLVDADGRPLNPNVIDMAKKRLEKAQKAGLVANHLHCGCGHHHAA